MGDRFSLAGQTAIVTGASSGLGEMMARGLAQAGCALLLAARREGELARVAGISWRLAARIVAARDTFEGRAPQSSEFDQDQAGPRQIDSAAPEPPAPDLPEPAPDSPSP